MPEVPVDHPGDLDQLRGAAEISNHRLRVRSGCRRRRPVRHHHAQEPFRPDGLGDEVRHQGRVDPTREPEHGLLEPGLFELAADERCDRRPRHAGVDAKLVRELEHRRAISVRCGSRRPRNVAHGSTGMSGSPAPSASSVDSVVSPARSAMSLRHSRATSSGRSSRSRGNAMRSRRTSARSTSTMNRPSSNIGALNTGAPVGPITSDPPQNDRDSSTPTRLQNTTNDVVSWA